MLISEKYIKTRKNVDCWISSKCSDKTSDCTHSCIFYGQLLRLLSNCGLSKPEMYSIELEMSEVDYNAHQKLIKIRDDVEEFVSSGRNLLLCSNNTGNAKTTWAVKIMLHYFNEMAMKCGLEILGWFVNVPMFIHQMKNYARGTSEEYQLQELLLKNIELVIWDDIASTRLTENDRLILLAFIGERINNGKANIFTSNLVSDSDLVDVLGERITTRIRSDYVIELKDYSHRERGN